VLVAFGLRALGWSDVEIGGGEIVLKFDDASYHARRAHFSFVRFPRVLSFDHYLDHPDGSPSPWPPLYDLALGGAARLWSRSELGFERTAAWISPLLGALTLLPVFAAGRTLGGTGIGLLAAALLATLPIHVLYSDVGNPDHHAAVSLLGTIWLALLLHAARRPGAPGAAAALAGVRAALLFTWSGSLLYLAVAEGLLLGVGVLLARRDLLLGQALGATAAVLLVAPVVAASGEPLGGWFSGVALSFTHPLALAGVAVVAACAAALLGRRPEAPLGARIASAALPGALLAGAALAVPGLRAALLPGIGFVGAADVWAPTNFEQQPLFATHRGVTGLPGASALYGGFAFTLPLALAAVCERLRVPALRAPALLLAGWTAAFGALAMTQIRFGNEFAPAAALANALLLVAGWRAAARLGAGRRRSAARGALVALALLALWPGFRALLLPRLERDLARLRGPAPAGDPALATPGGTLHRFAQQMRDATPETSGFLDPEVAPEYGVLAPATFGHALRWPGRRAVPVDPFGPYLDDEHFALAESFWRARDEDEAVAILDQLEVRYVVTTGAMALPGPTIAQRLHARGGSAFAAHPHLGRFRLVLAGPAGGRGFPGWPASREPPYKLFERVPGALLEVAAPPGARVTAQIGLTAAAGQAFEFEAVATANAAGRAQLRLPYASEPSSALVPDGPWRVRAAAQELRVAVSEADVQSGARVSLGE
jgi:asparagine N-glycosylation enzyme membrane subunit Stt3